jgi:GTP cyclohydrolase I
MRGDRQPHASTVTIAARGELSEPAARAELIALLSASRASGAAHE